MTSRSILMGIAVAVLPAYAAAQAPKPTATVIVDRDMTISAGAFDLLALQRTLIDAEDRVLPPNRFVESTMLRRAAGIAYRAAKWIALDRPQDRYLMVVGHEVFGHGSRLRELGAKDVKYGVDAPPPYGPGGGVTEFNGELDVARAELIGIATSGIEFQNTIASEINRQALARRSMHHREAWMYLEARLDGLSYIRSVSPRSSEGHDVRAFLDGFNDRCDPPECRPQTRAGLKRQALLMLADPMLAYSAYGFGWSYLVRGRAMVAAPMIPIARGIRYLPALRYELTPYGVEWTAEHHVLRGSRLTSVSLRFGDAGQRRPWGIGVVADDVMQTSRVRVSAAAHLWRQPPLETDVASGILTTGGLAAATANVALGRLSRVHAIAMFLQAGYKSDGFSRGERLRAGAIARVGVKIKGV